LWRRGSGFAIVENLGYAAGLGVSVLIVRSLAAPITHALFTGLAGYYLAKAHFSDRGGLSKFMTVGLALLAAIGLHSVWNAPTGLADLVSDLFLLLYLLVIPFYVYLLRRFLGRMESAEAQAVQRLVDVREPKVLASP
jgi:RsiW-degrading membrane proteinase PrsW (M82 family)